MSSSDLIVHFLLLVISLIFDLCSLHIAEKESDVLIRMLKDSFVFIELPPSDVEAYEFLRLGSIAIKDF